MFALPAKITWFIAIIAKNVSSRYGAGLEKWKFSIFPMLIVLFLENLIDFQVSHLSKLVTSKNMLKLPRLSGTSDSASSVGDTRSRGLLEISHLVDVLTRPNPNLS